MEATTAIQSNIVRLDKIHEYACHNEQKVKHKATNNRENWRSEDKAHTHKLITKHNGINEFESHVSTGCTLPFQNVRYKHSFTLFYFRCGKMRCCLRRRRRWCHFSILARWLLGGCFWRISVFRSHYSVYVCVFVCKLFTTNFSNPNERERVERTKEQKKKVEYKKVNLPYQMVYKHATKHLKLMTNIYTT